MDREAAFRASRLRQPRDEIERKAIKARRRQNIWTAEELDFARIKGRELSEALKPLMIDPLPRRSRSDRHSLDAD